MMRLTVFITTSLNNNVISDFRARKYMEYYNHSGTAFITGMKIVPLQTSELKNILRLEIGYPQNLSIIGQRVSYRRHAKRMV